MKLKELRKQNKKTQEEIANYLNITQVSYGRYELGTSEPNLQILNQLANYYKVSIDYLIGRETNNEFAYLQDNEKALLTAFRQMNKDNQLRFLAQAQGILIAQN